MTAGRNQQRIKRLDLLGGVGAGVLGAGLALIFAEWLKPFAVAALLLGALSHGWAMFQKARLERQAGVVQPLWAHVAEWACWVMLICLFAVIAYRTMT